MDKNISFSFSIAHKKVWFLAEFLHFSTLFWEFNFSPNPSMLHPYQKFHRPCEKLSKFLKKKKLSETREYLSSRGLGSVLRGPTLSKIEWNFRMKIYEPRNSTKVLYFNGSKLCLSKDCGSLQGTAELLFTSLPYLLTIVKAQNNVNIKKI